MWTDLSQIDRSADVIRNFDECTVVKLPTLVHGQRQSVVAGRKKCAVEGFIGRLVEVCCGTCRWVGFGMIIFG
ncbi:hypothetical protein CEXT_64451 [Caerostris extrusa]|uniref:Uncharacterized protein n=1 Tax=Caerostris extrusa TaxID=172846 RepID=A0AAV4RY23_CAEEX|nr:hypothetical protein CEXT_64451 [Caerostris extrusa]